MWSFFFNNFLVSNPIESQHSLSLEGAFRGQQLCNYQGHFHLDQAARSPIQPNAEHFKRCGIHCLFRKPVPLLLPIQCAMRLFSVLSLRRQWPAQMTPPVPKDGTGELMGALFALDGAERWFHSEGKAVTLTQLSQRHVRSILSNM